MRGSFGAANKVGGKAYKVMPVQPVGKSGDKKGEKSEREG